MSAESKPKAPKWATEPFHRFLEEIERLGQVLHLSMRGIAMVRAVPRAVEVLAEVDEADPKETEARVASAKAEAELAQREVDEGFPVLHAQALVTTWSLLESLVREFVSAWLRHESGALSAGPVAKIKIPVAEFVGLSEEERCVFLCSLLERELASPLRRGVSRFESLLEPFGLSGPVPSDVSRDLFELSELRNVLVHRRGIADSRIVESCPWLDLRIGDEVRVSHERFSKLCSSVSRYMICLLVRVGERFGVKMSSYKEGALPPPNKALQRTGE